MTTVLDRTRTRAFAEPALGIVNSGCLSLLLRVGHRRAAKPRGPVWQTREAAGGVVRQKRRRPFAGDNLGGSNAGAGSRYFSSARSEGTLAAAARSCSRFCAIASCDPRRSARISARDRAAAASRGGRRSR